MGGRVPLRHKIVGLENEVELIVAKEGVRERLKEAVAAGDGVSDAAERQSRGRGRVVVV